MKPFEIIVFAIVALAMMSLVAYFYLPYMMPEPIEQALKKGVTRSQSNVYLGQTYDLGLRTIPSGTNLTKYGFDTTFFSFAFECNNPRLCCEKKQTGIEQECGTRTEWDYTYMKFNSTQQINVSTRCYEFEGVPICRAYFGQLPAQAEITDIKIESQDNDSTLILVTIKNTGKSNMPPSINSLKLEKQVNGEWQDTMVEFVTQETKTLFPGESQEILWDIEAKTAGKYRSVFKVEGENSGFDTNSFVFEITSNQFCSIDSLKEIYTEEGMEPNTYREFHYCVGCNYAYECSAEWSRKTPGTTYEPNTKDDTYCIKSTYDGVC